MTLALIDGDIVVYRAASPLQHTADWGDGAGAQPMVNTSEAVRLAINITKAWARKAGCSDIVVALSDTRPTFRHALAPSYKANRRNLVKPLAFQAVRDGLTAAFDTLMVNGLEADDLLGIAHTDPAKGGRSVVVSIDKDLMTIPGTHMNPITDQKPTRVGPSTAVLWWMTQVLTGDRVDNIAGLKGCGPVKAGAILGKLQPTVAEMWPAVVAAYLKAGMTEADALLNARLTRILRHSDYHPDDMEITLWHPTRPRRVALLPAATAPSPTTACAS